MCAWYWLMSSRTRALWSDTVRVGVGRRTHARREPPMTRSIPHTTQQRERFGDDGQTSTPTHPAGVVHGSYGIVLGKMDTCAQHRHQPAPARPQVPATNARQTCVVMMNSHGATLGKRTSPIMPRHFPSAGIGAVRTYLRHASRCPHAHQAPHTAQGMLSTVIHHRQRDTHTAAQTHVHTPSL